MRILLADNQARVRFALRALLDQQPGLTVVGEASEVGDTLLQVKTVQPDLVLLDWDLRGSWNNLHLLVGVTELLLALHKVCPAVKIIALSARPELRPAILAAGVDAFVSKTDPPERLLAAIQETVG
jgi:DNA-binding NarL/FixJ family response regulator